MDGAVYEGIGGKKGRIYNCFCIPAPQGAVEDGQIRDTKTLGENLKVELSQRKIKTKKVYFSKTYAEHQKNVKKLQKANGYEN